MASTTKDPQHPPLSDEEPTSDEPVERELQDRLADQKRLDRRFTPKQLEHLMENKDSYRYASQKQRKEIAQTTGDRFLKQIQKAGRDPSKTESAALYENVKQWYAQRARSRHGPMHWTINWTGRHVFYKENMSLIQETQKKLYELATGLKTMEEQDEALDVDLLEEDDIKIPEDSTKPVQPFHFFQRAVSAEWNAISDKERAAYEAKALLWRERGPTPEERQRLAEKETGRVLHQFADNVYRQMGVRLHYLVTYQDTSGEHVAFSLDFNNQIDSGVSFKQTERGYLEKIDLENRWAGFVRRTLQEAVNDVKDNESTKQPRKRGDPVPVELNKFGEPIIPDISDLPRGVKAHRYLPDLVRSVMRHDYACARGLPLNDPNSAPPWKEMMKDWSKFIDLKYWPASWPVGDPGSYGVEKCKIILRHWLERQKRGDVPFQFHSYWTGGDIWEPREPRKIADDSDEYQEVAPTKTKKPKKRSTKGKASASNTKNSEEPEKASAITPARLSATTAVRNRVERSPNSLPSTPPPTFTPTKPQAPRRRSSGKTVKIESSSEEESENGQGSADGGESNADMALSRSTPRTRMLVGATARLQLNTPGGEGEGSTIGSGEQEGEEEPLDNVEDCEKDELQRTTLRKEKQALAKERARVRRLKASDNGSRNPGSNVDREAMDGEAGAAGASGGSQADHKGGHGEGGAELDGDRSLEDTATGAGEAYAKTDGDASEKVSIDGRMGCVEAPSQVGGRDPLARAGEKQGRGRPSTRASLGKSGTTDGGEVQVYADHGAPSTPGRSRARTQPKEDRLLLLEAAKHMATSEKRKPKPKVHFGEQVEGRKRK